MPNTLRYYFITGTSRGLGRALAEVLLEDDNNRVVGISRGDGPVHAHYTHHALDLSDALAVRNWTFPNCPDAAQLVLINNAGMIEPIARAGEQVAFDIEKNIFLNLTAPLVLTNAFLKMYAESSVQKLIVHISSGAGRRGIDAWNVYCASKAGLDNHARALHEEFLVTEKTNQFIFSIAPGILDTAMQSTIRAQDSRTFSLVDQFTAYHETGQLVAPRLVAEKICSIFNSPEKIPNPVIALSDIP